MVSHPFLPRRYGRTQTNRRCTSSPGTQGQTDRSPIRRVLTVVTVAHPHLLHRYSTCSAHLYHRAFGTQYATKSEYAIYTAEVFFYDIHILNNCRRLGAYRTRASSDRHNFAGYACGPACLAAWQERHSQQSHKFYHLAALEPAWHRR